jgi:hypothetical protein
MENDAPFEIVKAWRHSHEEDSADQMVFRPASFGFPPSRGRSGYEFLPDGEVIVSDPGADDKVGSRTGQWRLNASGLEIAMPGMETRQMKVISITQDKLVLAHAV